MSVHSKSNSFAGLPGPPGPQAEAPLIPPELLFRNDFTLTKGEERMKRDLENMERLAAELDDADIDELMGIEKKPSRKTSSKKKKPKDDLGPKFLDMYSSIYSMRQELDRIRKPVGTRESPARTCKDLWYGHNHLENGWYWIDPNLGMVDDAIYVFCNMTAEGETCVHPGNDLILNATIIINHLLAYRYPQFPDAKHSLA